MAQKNILNKVKTASGYDTLYPLTPYQIYQATAVTGDGASYNITIDLPAENITKPVMVCFVPNMANVMNATVSVNELAAKPLYVNNSPITGEIITNASICTILYDPNSDRCNLISFTGGIFTKDVSDLFVLNESKASLQEAQDGALDNKWMTPSKVAAYVAAKNKPSNNMSIKTGTISHNAIIPKTAGYTHYLYFVSFNSGFHTNNVFSSAIISIALYCYVDQSTRRVTAQIGVDDTVYEREMTKANGTANYMELAWN